MADLTEEMKVLVTAEVDRAIKNLQSLDKKTSGTEKLFKKLGKTIGAVFSVKAILDFTQKSINAYEDHTQTLNVLNSTLKATGATAWTTSSDLQNMASELQNTTNYSGDSINKMQSVLLGFKNITGDTFGTATKAILDMATVMQMDLSSAAQAVGKALDDPINGITSLQRQGFRFTDAQKEMIQSLIETGDTAAAQKIILDELNTTYGGAAEAAVKSSTQIKNSLGDLLTAYGKEFTELFNYLNGGNDKNRIKEALDWAAKSVNEGIEGWKKLFAKDYQTDYYQKLGADEKLVEATRNLEGWTKQLKEAKKEKDKLNAQSQVNWWTKEVEGLKQAQKERQLLQQQENDRIAAENKIYDLMTAVNGEYAKLSATDPSVQLENYKKRLSEIASERANLSTAPATIDTTSAIKSLDYLEKAFKDKIKKLTDDGKKTWKDWWEKITSVSQDSFTTGKEAGELYVKGLETSLSANEEITKVLGENFDISGFLENQMDEVQKNLISLLTIPEDQIDEPFNLIDQSINELIRKYDDLKNARNKALIVDEIAELQRQVDNLGKTERELTEAQLKNKGATDEQIKSYMELYDQLHKTDDKSESLSEKLGRLAEEQLSGSENWKEYAHQVGELVTALSDASFDATLSGFKAFGEALGEGKDASEALNAALAEMAQTILNQLPTMFMQAGLQLIAQNQFAMGLAFIAAAGSTAITAGYVNGKINSSNAKQNALGGVYGESSYSAFANGGTFTNQIVSRPTAFKFKNGSGFGNGIMGEAGPEAIMPLKRTADGSLGVASSAANVAVPVYIYNYSGTEASAQEKTDDNGNKRIEVQIGAYINTHIASGKADKALKSRYGINAQGV